jgi:hypothetical protein
MIMSKTKNDFDRGTSWYIFDAYLIYTVDAHNDISYFQFGFAYVSYVLYGIWGGLCLMLHCYSASYWDKGTKSDNTILA